MWCVCPTQTVGGKKKHPLTTVSVNSMMFLAANKKRGKNSCVCEVIKSKVRSEKNNRKTGFLHTTTTRECTCTTRTNSSMEKSNGWTLSLGIKDQNQIHIKTRSTSRGPGVPREGAVSP